MSWRTYVLFITMSDQYSFRSRKTASSNYLVLTFQKLGTTINSLAKINMDAWVMHEISIINYVQVSEIHDDTSASVPLRKLWKSLAWKWLLPIYHSESSSNKCPWAMRTAQKMEFSIKDVFSRCGQIRSFLRIWSLKKSLSENFILCVVQ